MKSVVIFRPGFCYNLNTVTTLLQLRTLIIAAKLVELDTHTKQSVRNRTNSTLSPSWQSQFEQLLEAREEETF